MSTVRVTPRGTTQPCVYWPGLGEAAVGFDLDGARYLDSVPFEASPHASRRVPALRVPRVVPRWMCWKTTIARRTIRA